MAHMPNSWEGSAVRKPNQSASCSASPAVGSWELLSQSLNFLSCSMTCQETRISALEVSSAQPWARHSSCLNTLYYYIQGDHEKANRHYFCMEVEAYQKWLEQKPLKQDLEGQPHWCESIQGTLASPTNVRAHFHIFLSFQPSILGRKRLNIIWWQTKVEQMLHDTKELGLFCEWLL